MKDMFDYAREGNFRMLKKTARFKNINKINLSNCNCLLLTLTGEDNQKERIEIIKYLLNRGIDINFKGGTDYQNALIFILSDRRLTDMNFKLQVSKLLIEYGIDINAKDKHDGTALSKLVCLNDIQNQAAKELINLLLNKGAIYDEKDKHGNSVIDYAKMLKKVEFLKMIGADIHD